MLLGLSPKGLIGLVAGVLVVVAVMVRPGGTVETASDHLASVVQKKAGADPAAPAASPARPRTAWYAPDEGPVGPPPTAYPAAVTVPPGDPQPVRLDPPPTGPDFPPEAP